LGWARSSELFGYVPGARIPLVPPADGVFTGWDFPWARSSTLLQYFENTAMLQAALSSAYTQAALGISESLFPGNGILIGDNYVWDGGTPNQYYTGYYTGSAPGGWASWANVEIANDSLYSPETRVNTPGVYSPYHYSLRRFTAYADLDLSCYSVDTAYLVSDYPRDALGRYVFPLDDSIFVFVNGRLVYWASTDVIGNGNVAQNRSSFMGVPGQILLRENPVTLYPFSDGWYLTLGGTDQIANIAPYFRNGKNVIDVIADDYYQGGGMSRFDLVLSVTPR
jgi:hypothetical protein